MKHTSFRAKVQVKLLYLLGSTLARDTIERDLATGAPRTRFIWLARTLQYLIGGALVAGFVRAKQASVAGASKCGSSSRSLVVQAIGTLGPGGAERQLVQHVEQMKGRYQCEILVTVCSFEAPNSDYYRHRLSRVAEVVELAELPNTKSLAQIGYLRRHLIRRLMPWLEPMVAAIRGKNVMVLHCWLDDPNLQCGVAGLLSGVPKVILGVRSVPPYQFPDSYQVYYYPIYHWLARQEEVTLVSNSRRTAESWEKWLGLAPGRIQTVVNGLVPGKAAAGHVGKPSAVPHQLTVGGVFRFSSEKRVELWLDMAAELRSLLPSVQFSLVGDGSQLNAAKAYARERGIGDAVTFHGLQTSVHSFMRQMDVLVLTSDREGLPNVLIEAQALGIPVAATDAGGARETFIPDVTGKILEGADAQEFAETVFGMLTNAAWMANAKATAPRYILEEFSQEAVTDRFWALYGRK